MNVINVKDIIKETEGKLIIGKEDIICENYSKDTRTIQEGDVYIGIKGESFDGNLFWKEALNKGASVVIVENVSFENEELSEFKNKAIIKVENTLEALGKIAKYKRSLYNIPVIAITGSVGKTSTKDIVANVVSQKYKTLKTEGNFNNNIGLPLTILKLKDHEAAVIEMGMNHFDEISYLTNIAKPTISIITNIGTSHIGNLGSRENILKAKLEILEGMENKKLIINNDNDLLNKYYKENVNKIEIITYGIENKSDVNAKDIEMEESSSSFICEDKEESYKINVPVGGLHFVYNAICAATVGKELNIPKEQIKNAIETFELTKKRMDIEALKNGAKIINDTYNASLESMKAALNYLSSVAKSRKIAVLGDMFELGEFSENLHQEVGKEVVKNKIDVLICNGKNAKYIAKGAKDNGMKEEDIHYFAKAEDVIMYLKKEIKSTDTILFKASNGMRFFNLVESLKKEYEENE